MTPGTASRLVLTGGVVFDGAAGTTVGGDAFDVSSLGERIEAVYRDGVRVVG